MFHYEKVQLEVGYRWQYRPMRVSIFSFWTGKPSIVLFSQGSCRLLTIFNGQVEDILLQVNLRMVGKVSHHSTYHLSYESIVSLFCFCGLQDLLACFLVATNITFFAGALRFA